MKRKFMSDRTNRRNIRNRRNRRNIRRKASVILLFLCLMAAAGCGKRQETFLKEAAVGAAESDAAGGMGTAGAAGGPEQDGAGGEAGNDEAVGTGKEDLFGGAEEYGDGNRDKPVVFSSESMEKWVRYSLRYKIEEGEPLTEKMLREMTELTIRIEDEGELEEIVLLREDMERLASVNAVSISIKPETAGEWVEGYENLQFIPGLETLWIEDEALSDFGFLQDCSLLKNITVMSNELPEHFLDHCHSLERVQIYNCVLPEALCLDCPKLKSLTVMGDVPDPGIFAHLTGLEEIVMNETGIDDLEFVRGMKSLKSLCIRNNRIRDISPVFELPCLEKLYINDNELAAFDLKMLPDSLIWLAVSGNPQVTLSRDMFMRYSVAELWHDKGENLKLYAEELRSSQRAFDLQKLEGQWTGIVAEGDIVFGELTDDLKCEIDDCFTGDMDGDGADDLGVIVNAVNEYGPQGRWLYVYPKKETGYGDPYEPIALGIPCYAGAAWSDAVSGAVICDERLIVQQVSGTSTSSYDTCIYYRDEEGWKEETKVTTMFSFVSDGIIQYIVENRKERVTRYMYGRNEEGAYEKVCTGNYGFDENPYIGMPVFSLDHTDFSVHSHLRKMPFSTDQALEAAIEGHFAGDVTEKVQNDPMLVKNYEKILGIEIPDYYYLVKKENGFLVVHFEDFTEEEGNTVYEITAEYYDKDENTVTAPFESYYYNAQTGNEENADIVFKPISAFRNSCRSAPFRPLTDRFL